MQDVRTGPTQIKALDIKVNTLIVEEKCIIEINVEERYVFRYPVKIQKVSESIRRWMDAFVLCLPTCVSS